MREERIARLRWGRIVGGGLMAFAGSFLLVFLMVGAYACRLGFQARGAPDPERIQQFGQQAGPSWGPVLLAVGTVIAAFWVARKVSGKPLLHGLLVGVIGVVLSLPLVGLPNLREVAGLLVTVAAGLLGGFLAARRRGHPGVPADSNAS